MSKLGWIIAAALGSLLIIGAGFEAGRSSEEERLSEIKLILMDTQRIQFMKYHREIFKHGIDATTCDFGSTFPDKCETHEYDVNRRRAFFDYEREAKAKGVDLTKEPFKTAVEDVRTSQNKLIEEAAKNQSAMRLVRDKSRAEVYK